LFHQGVFLFWAILGTIAEIVDIPDLSVSKRFKENAYTSCGLATSVELGRIFNIQLYKTTAANKRGYDVHLFAKLSKTEMNILWCSLNTAVARILNESFAMCHGGTA
jgi:hypothetical protein